MRRQGWAWLVGAGLCGTLLPACTNILGGEAGLRPTPRPTQDPTPRPAAPPAPATPERISDAVGERFEPPTPPPVAEPPRPVARLGPPIEVAAATPAPAAPSAPVPSASAKPADEPPVLAALRCLLEKRPQEALARLELYDKSNQELLLFLLPLIVRLSECNLERANPQDVAVVVEELNGLAAPMRSRAALAVEAMCFCKRIETFGVYEPLPSDYRFRPRDLVQIYVELKNFTSRKRKNDAGETRHVIDLASSVEICDYAGKRVYATAFERPRPDESRAPRQDYFDSYRFCVPDIAPGAYTLWIEVEDRGTRPPRKARRSLDFRVTNLPARGS